MSGRAAAFLDRDGTLVHDAHYLSRPDQLRLMPGAAEAVRALNEAGVAAVVITNQSGIARGYFSTDEYRVVERALGQMLAGAGARLDGSYHCPHHPEHDGPCDCRKPGTALYRRAAADLQLDPAASLYVGDRWRDVAPALELGGVGVLVPSPDTPPRRTSRAPAAMPSWRRRSARRWTASCGGAPRIASGEPPGLTPRPGRGYNARMISRVAVLASGGGSNLQALLDHTRALGDRAAAEVVLVASNQAAAGALDRARAANVPAAVLGDPADVAALDALLDEHAVDLVVLAGYLKLVPPEIVRRYDGAMLNVHPALLPAFGGPGMYGRRVHEAVLRSGARVSGVTVHFVNEEYDRGAIAAQWPVPVLRHDTPQTLAARVLQAEHRLYPRVVHAVAAGLLTAVPPVSEPPGALATAHFALTDAPSDMNAGLERLIAS